MPSRERTPPIDAATWSCLVRACGSLCCGEACKKPAGVPLQQGHIKSDTNGGALNFMNVIPLCKPCNGKLGGASAPDHRPPGWLDKFLKLILAENEVRIRWRAPILVAGTLPAREDGETTGLVDLQNIEFEANSHYTSSDGTATTPTADGLPTTLNRSMSAREAREIVEHYCDEWIISTADEPKPRKPLKKRREYLEGLLLRGQATKEDLRVACVAFINDRPWVRDEARGTVADDCWIQLTDNFFGYLKDGRKIFARVAEEKAIKARWAAEAEANNRARMAEEAAEEKQYMDALRDEVAALRLWLDRLDETEKAELELTLDGFQEIIGGTRKIKMVVHGEMMEIETWHSKRIEFLHDAVFSLLKMRTELQDAARPEGMDEPLAGGSEPSPC
jgi:hypothetical protein